MTNYFTPGPDNVPDEILKVTSSFKKKVFLAILGLIAFITFYFGLMIWFGYQTYHLFYILTHGAANSFFIIITMICFAVLALFMLKSLIFFNKKAEIPYKQLTKEDQPDLYDFIHAVADETGAPKPHKIYISDRVNASVSYDLSLINIIIPSKKNLEVGMGLLNVLNLTEFKAILAHEFGHFAQRSMLLGRYVYVAHQIAERIVNKRDLLDRALQGLSSFDLRVAWIGWIISIIVWAIRSLIGVLFEIVVISERALSREMEFQADNVAVSVTGSDALVYGLHKLGAADQGYRESLGIVNQCLQKKKAVPNLYSLQTNYIDKMGHVLDDPNYGKISEEIRQNENVRLFKNGLINPPEMWSTHPSDMDRENNAKRSYLRAKIDQRSALELVRNKELLFKEITATLVSSAKVETELIPDEEAIEMMNDVIFDWTFLDPQFKGVYLNRGFTRNFESVSKMYDGRLTDSIEKEYEKLYPDSIKTDLELHREYVEEIGLLEAAQNQVRTAENRKIVYRGNEIKRKMIPDILIDLKEKELSTRQKLADHDQRCRLVNYQAANTLHPAYGNYLKSIANVLHYAEHTLADLTDIHKKFNGTLYVIFADGRVTETEQLLLISEARAMRKVMRFACMNAENITLNDTLLAKLKISKTADLFEEFKLEDPELRNMEAWLNVYSSWYEVCLNGLTKLRNASLELLLDSEQLIQQDYLEKKNNFKNDSLPVLADDYPRLMNGDERKVVEKLSFWDKFIGGIGLFPTIAKFSAAALILFGAIFVGRMSIESTLYIHNSFDQQLSVSVNGTVYNVGPKSHVSLIISAESEIVTKTLNGKLVESFNGSYDAANQNYIYNIGYGDYFVEYEMVYGFGNVSDPIFIGSNRWFPARTDYILEDAPDQIMAKFDGETRDAIIPILEDPYLLPELDLADKKTQKMIISHVRFDDPLSPYMSKWMALNASFDSEMTEVKKIAEQSPENIPAQRIIMDISDDAEKKKIRKSNESLFARTGNPDFKYLAIRAMEQGHEQDVKFIEAVKQFPKNGWLNLAAAYVNARDENWAQADQQYANIIEYAPNISSAIFMDYARVHKLHCELTNAPFIKSDFYFDSQVEYFVKMEDGDQTIIDSDVELIPYYLSLQKYDEVEDIIATLPLEQRGHYLWMLSASQPNNQQAFEAAKSATLNPNFSTDVYLIAMSVFASRNEDYSHIKDLMFDAAVNEEAATAILDFAEAVQNKDMQTANKMIDDAENFMMHTEYKLIACIIMKEKVPLDWYRQVNSILFQSEKPYLGYCIN